MRFHGGINTSEFLDFSVNVPDRRLPAEARRYIDDALLGVHLYPSIDNAELCDRLGGVLGARALLGNGATQLIYASARLFAGKRVLIVEPAFTEYAEALRRSQVQHLNVLDCICDEDAVLDRIAGAAGGMAADAVYLCNPNNPVGVFYPSIIAKLAERLSAAAGDRAPVLVVDESFVDFVDGIDLQAHQRELVRVITSGEGEGDSAIRSGCGLLVIRSLTKAFSVPGLRLGYAFGTAELMSRLAAEIEPWSVGAVPAAFMEYLLDFGIIFDSRVNNFRVPRERLAAAFRELGFFVYPSVVNFVLFRAQEGINAFLREHSLNVRTCSDFMFLGGEHYRVAVRCDSDNQKLVKILKKKYSDKCNKQRGGAR